jgi:Domain of unknown function (DUF4920)
MKPTVLPLAFCYLLFCGCSAEAREQDKKAAPASQPTRKTALLDSNLFDQFGKGVSEGKALSPSELAANPAAYKDKHVRVKGEVTSVCKQMGCWLVVGDGKTRIRVFTKGHSFFVPKDCEGRTAVLEGTFSLTEESVAFRRHLLEDEGRFEEAKEITEPNKNALKLDAEGVALAKVAAKK